MYKIGHFGKSVLTLGIGTSVAQALSLLFYPILGRLYSPKEFGLLATITVISSIIVVIATGKYEQAILIAKTEKEAANILGLSILLSIFVCFIFTIIFICTASPFTYWLNAPDLKCWIIVVPIISFFIVAYNCYNEWYVKHSLFSQLSINKVLNSLSINLSKTFCGICGMPNGLVLGEMIGRGLSATLCAGSILRTDLHKMAEHISRDELLTVMKRYKKFPQYTMPDQLISCFSGALPMFFLMRYFNDTEYGYFAMVQLVLSFPATLIGQAVMDAFRKRASLDYENLGDCYFIFKKVFLTTLGLSSLAYIPVYLSFPFVFSFFLGQKWLTAGGYAQIILPAVTLGFIYNIFSAIWIISERLKERFWWQLYYCFALLISVGIGCYIVQDIKVVLLFYTIGLSSSYIIGIYCMYKYSKKRTK